jgi:hypothetical protein
MIHATPLPHHRQRQTGLSHEESAHRFRFVPEEVAAVVHDEQRVGRRSRQGGPGQSRPPSRGRPGGGCIPAPQGLCCPGRSFSRARGTEHGGGPADRLYASCGTYEPLIVRNRAMVSVFKSPGMVVRHVEAPDGHNWVNWRDRLRDALSWVLPGAPPEPDPHRPETAVSLAGVAHSASSSTASAYVALYADGLSSLCR